MIAGIFLRKGKSYDLLSFKDTILNTLNQFNTADKTGFKHNDNVILVQTTRFNTPESFFDPTAYIDEESKNVIVSWGRLDNRDELANKLDISEGVLKEICDSELILKSYLKWGEGCTEHIFGDFSFAIYNQQDNSLFCAVDHMGVKPFYYYMGKDYFIFASTVSVFHNLKLIPMQPDMEWAAKYMLHLSMDFEKTAYQGILKLKPATQLTVTQDTHRMKEYFKFNSEENSSLGNIENYLEIYRQYLEKAVSSRIRSKYKLGSESSGGIDSSTVTALAVKLFDQPRENFYIFGFATLEDEPQHLLQVSQHYGILNNFISCAHNSNSTDLNLRAFKAIGYPVEHSNATGHTIFYETAATFNVRTLLSGFGGDEFVTSIHGNLHLDQLLIEKKYLDLYKNLPGNSVTRFLRLMKRYYKHRFSSHKEYNPHFLQAWKQRWPYCIIKDDIIKKYQLEKKYFDTAKFDAGYTDINKFTLKNRFAPFVPTRTGNCTIMADSYGVDYRWPLLDVRLIQLFLSIPSSMKYYRGMGRYLHRRAVEDIVPHMVNWKSSKYMGKPVRKNTKRCDINIGSELHPDLMNLVDISKLGKLTNAINNPDKDAPFALQKNISTLNQLDLWMKNYHANGCEWNA